MRLMIIFLCVSAGFAQAPDTLWTRTVWDYGTDPRSECVSLDIRTDSTVIAVGAINTNHHSYCWTDLVWNHLQIDGSAISSGIIYSDDCTCAWGGRRSEPKDATAISDGGYVISGYVLGWTMRIDLTQDPQYFGPSYCGSFARLWKFDDTDSLEWVHDYTATRDSLTIGGEWIQSAIESRDLGYVLCGYVAGDVFVVKTDTDGEVIWQHRRETPLGEKPIAVVELESGSIVICGEVDSTAYGAATDVFLHKLSATGDNEMWWTFPTPQTDRPTSMIKTLDGHLAISNGGSSSFLLVDTLGNLISQRNYASAFTSIVQFPDGGFLASGVYPLARLWRLDAGGDTIWTGYSGYSEYALAVRDMRYIGYGSVVFGGSIPGSGGGQFFHVGMLAPESGILVGSPNGGEVFSIFQSDTVRWHAPNINSRVNIELNRSFPEGPWEMLATNTLNDSRERVTYVGPPSDRCRIRVTSVNNATVFDESNGDFEIRASQGYLALVRSSSPSVGISSRNYVLECPQDTQQVLYLRNFGTETVTVFTPFSALISPFNLTTTCGAFFALAPGQMSACSLVLAYTPSLEGVNRDTLRIQTDAVNGTGGYVRIPLHVEQIRTPADPQVVIQPQGIHARLSWSPVTESLGGCAVDVTAYLVYYANQNNGPYLFHGFTTDTTYVHTGVVHFAPAMFYQVVATTEDLPAVMNIPRESNLTDLPGNTLRGVARE